MELVAEYRRRAEETERLAECVLWEEQRRLILEAARIWRTMADQREAQLKGQAGNLIRTLASSDAALEIRRTDPIPIRNPKG
jgi:hypothetical protein